MRGGAGGLGGGGVGGGEHERAFPLEQEDEEFALALGRARARFDLACLRQVRGARKRDGTLEWRAYAWLLQNSSAEGYRRPRAKRGGAGGDGDGARPRVHDRGTATPGGDRTMTAEEVEQLVAARVRRVLQNLAAVPAEEVLEMLAGFRAGAAASGECAGANGEILPEIPETPAPPHSPGASLEVSAATSPDACASCPETPAAPPPRMSRRQRRAEERRLAREARTRERAEGGAR